MFPGVIARRFLAELVVGLELAAVELDDEMDVDLGSSLVAVAGCLAVEGEWGSIEEG